MHDGLPSAELQQHFAAAAQFSRHDVVERLVDAEDGDQRGRLVDILEEAERHAEELVDAKHPQLAPSLDAMETWKWEDEAEGLRFCGAHSTAWDTAFSIRAICASAAQAPLSTASSDAARSAYRWLVATQIQEELANLRREQRVEIRGGWCFSDGVHRWPVSDCTAEALMAIFAAEDQKAYLSIKTTAFPNGEISGFLTAVPEPSSVNNAILSISFRETLNF